VTAAVTIAAQVGSKATRDATFLSAFDAAELPKAMLAAAVLSAVGVLAMGNLLGRFGPRRLVPLVFAASAIGFAVEWWLSGRMPRVAAAVVYLHVAALGPLLISGFWSVVSERYDPHSAKRLIGRINAGAAVGGLIGGITAERVAAWLDARSMLLLLGGMHVLAALSCVNTARGIPRDAARTATRAFQGFRALRETPYLRLLGTLAALTALTSGVVDYAFKAEAASLPRSREELMSLFAMFYTATSLITVVAQAALSRRALERLGIGGTIALLPSAVVVAGALALVAAGLPTFVLAAGVEQVLSNSLYRSGYELLFTPLSPERKRATKALIDVGFDRAGGAVGSALVLAAVTLLPRHAALAGLALGVIASLGALVVALRLHRGYVDELARSLRSGLTLEEGDVVDATTRQTLADTTMALDREQLLREIEALRKELPPQSMRPVSLREPAPNEEVDPLLARLADLMSSDVERVRRALKAPLDRRLVGPVLALLGSEAHARAARRALTQIAPKVVGQLIDALLDPDTPPAVRRRLPQIIASAKSERAASGLFAALEDGERIVRERSALELVDMVRADPRLAPNDERVFELAGRELENLDDDASALPHLFRVMGLALDPEALELSLAALRSKDATLRGTSFEYLENVLPESLRVALWPRLKAYARAAPPESESRGARRSHRELAEELRRSREAIHIDLASLRPPKP
jgi:hypothetical protein